MKDVEKSEMLAGRRWCRDCRKLDVVIQEKERLIGSSVIGR